MYPSRELEEKLLNILWSNGIQEHDLLVYMLEWLSSDDTCHILEDFCDETDIDYEEELK